MRLKEPLFRLLCNNRVIHTKAREGKWLYVREAIFDRLAENDPVELLRSLLLKADQNIATVPSHVLQSIQDFEEFITEVTPSLVRSALKAVPFLYESLEKEEKLQLLKFLLKDECFSELSGLKLLPVSDGEFVPFSNSDKPIFISSREHPPGLVPTLSHRLLDQSLESETLTKLEAVAKTECSQLKLLEKCHVPSLLRESLSGNLTSGDLLQGYPVNQWLKCIWEYLGQHFKTNEDLSLMNNLPLVPVDLSKGTLTMLANPSKVVVRCLDDQRLEKNVSAVLENFRVIVVESLPDYLKHHPCVLDTYVHRPTVHGVLQAMAVSASDCLGMLSAVLLDMQAQGRGDDVLSLRKFISKTESLEPREKEIISSLPLFEETGQPHSFVSKKDVWGAAPQDADDYLVTLPTATKFIDARADDSKRLVTLLNMKPVTMIDFLIHGIFPCVRKGTYCSEDIDKVMNVVIKRYDIHSSGNRARLEEEMRDLAFVPTKHNRVKPRDIFDPKNDLLRRIFAEEDVFPIGEQYNDPTVLAVLQKLGMKSEHDITAQDLLQSTRIVSEIPNMTSAEVKSEAIMAYLESNPNKLKEPIDGKEFGDVLHETSWISRIKQTPDMFPKDLPFTGAGQEKPKFYKPSEIHSADFVDLIGSVRPIVKVQSCGKVAKYFGWDKKPQVTVVVKHLKLVIDCYSQQEKSLYMMMVAQLYSFLVDADHALVRNTFEEMNIVRWIWNGDGFSTPSEMLAEKPLLDLSPYIFSLPPELKQYQKLFEMHGLEIECGVHVLVRVLRLMKEKYDQNNPPIQVNDVKRDLRLSLNILNDLMSRDNDLPSLGEEGVLIPTFVKGDEFVRLVPAKSCVYREHEWLQQENDEEEDGYFFVHPLVSNSTAEFFGIRTLGHVMLDPDELGEEYGQEEKLTRRLNRLLEEYTDGFAVPKELIQNADDAGATEIKFLYDERQNEDALTCLIDEGMRECQGAALWVYNDAEFRDEDFENLTKLSGATKEHNTEKIGKFGLGFNAVYNLTDVPMLVSRNYFLILDPHKSHLGKAIKNKSKPGWKINLNKNVKGLRRFRNQFKPFNRIFGCDLELKEERNSYSGTLFRFPLRTKEQAIRSEIKQLHYDSNQVKALLLKFILGARSLLLFTQNIRKVSILHLPRKGNPPKVIFELTKELSEHGILKKLSVPFRLSPPAEKLSEKDQVLLTQCNFLKASSEFAKSMDHCKNLRSALLQSALKVIAVSTVSKYGRRFFGDKETLHSSAEKWLVVSSMGTGEAMQFAQQNRGLLSAAGVAVQLTTEPTSVSAPICPPNNPGVLFCYLPLPIDSGLPVHVNGAFAVASNRRSLKEKTEDDKDCTGVEWNDILLKDSVCAAYLDLVTHLKPAINESGSGYLFHSLWPRDCKVPTALKPLSRSFYENLVHKNIPVFPNGTGWVGVNNVVFLHPKFRNDERIGNTAFEVLKLLVRGDKAVIDLPFEVLDSFEMYGLSQEIQSGQFDEKKFFRELFFPNISTLPQQLREILVLYALDDKEEKFHDLIEEYECIPTSPCGMTLKRPRHLINPKRDAGRLFLSQDGRFPHGTQETFLNPLRMSNLERLGMVTDNISWLELAERSESIWPLNQEDSIKAKKRSKTLIKFLDKKLKCKEPLSQKVKDRILQAKFLPALQKPKSFPLSWKGNQVRDGNRQDIVAPLEGFLKKEKYLVCCSEVLIDLHIPEIVQELLMLDSKKPALKHVMVQLEEAIAAVTSSSGFKEVRKTCMKSYKYLEEAVKYNQTEILHLLREKKFILVGSNFWSAKQMAFNLDTDCSPYLQKVPDELARTCPYFLKAVGVRDVFCAQDFIDSLECMKRKFGKEALNGKSLLVAFHLATQLEKSLEDPKVIIPIDKKRESIYLPNSDGVMQLVKDLCFEDGHWIAKGTNVQFVSPKIPPSTATMLGVKTTRQEALQKRTLGISFGQRERLTNRLKRILNGYPCGKELLKELLQNADDAMATEVCFVKDPRTHPKKYIFDPCWEPLQGPALCVYNNKPFKKADIEGIQNLGQGSKGDDPNKTGQYGVGFNAVYHLTDVPSFMSQGEEIGEVLCVFDPHCQYVPDANPQEPGRMYNTEGIKEMFPDVFSCYLGGNFPLKNSTMFRFPLRTQEMADNSQLSKTTFALNDLTNLMKALKGELFEVLLFLRSVKKITLCDLNESGNVVNSYFVEAVMSHEDSAKREEFNRHRKEMGEEMKKRGFLNKAETCSCSYVMNLRDSCENKETWFIVQQLGFENDVPKSVVEAYKRHDLGMLPLGGVACLLEQASGRRKKMLAQGKKKAFCFLPLPLATGLPVHINGHFALDHEARRNMWRDETCGYRTDWNEALLNDVIASCYLKLLAEVRSLYRPKLVQGTVPLNAAEQDLVKTLEDYENLFPKVSQANDDYWVLLVKSLYRKMNEKQMRLLPVVREEPNKQQVQITLLPPAGPGKDQAFFDNLESDRRPNDENQEEMSLSEILIQLGFNLVRFSLSIWDALIKSDVAASCVSASSVMTFLKGYSCQDSHCSIGSIPTDVSKTPLLTEKGVEKVLRYCKDGNEDFFYNLPGLPLLLTQDNVLRVFDTSSPRFLSQYYDILPQCKEMFVHDRLRLNIFHDQRSEHAHVFKPFDVKGFATYLHRTLPPAYHRRTGYVSWSPDKGSAAEPSRRWIFRVWSFLSEIVRAKNLEIEDSRSTHKELEPLLNWSILPARTRSTALQVSSRLDFTIPQTARVLVPLKLGKSIIDCTYLEMALMQKPLAHALRKLNPPELDTSVLGNSSYTHLASLARYFIASLEIPESLLYALNHWMTTQPDSLRDKLSPDDCRTLLKYFSDNVNSLKSTNPEREILRRLPFYLATHGNLISLDNKPICLLKSGIPREELSILQREVNVLFLECVEGLSNLYGFLNFNTVSRVNVYCEFIFPHFKLFSKEAREMHLRYVQDDVFTIDDDNMKIIDCLKTSEVVTLEDGSLKRASCFYDPLNNIFQIMLPEDKFPPYPFNSSLWLPFMKKIGMVHEVSPALFKKFAEDIAREASEQTTKKTDRKSKVLVSHLFTPPHVKNASLLQDICGVRFVVSDSVRPDLLQLHSQYEDEHSHYISFKDSVVADFTETAWTVAHLLPNWAHPRSHSVQDNFLLSKLNVLLQPSPEMVISHCSNICCHLAKQNGCMISESEIATRKSVMGEIYKFFSENVSSSYDLKEKLENVPCILVEDGKRFVQAKQTVLNLLEEDEIPPFLFRVPLEFGAYHLLFQSLGCSKSAETSHYALVLEMMYRQCNGKKLLPMKVESSLKAVRGLFERLERATGEEVPLPYVYVPAVYRFNSVSNGNPSVTLHKSTDVIFDDAPRYRGRIGSFNELFVVDIKMTGLQCTTLTNYRDYIVLLPSESRPKMLSEEVKETLVHLLESANGVCIAESLKAQLCSEQFIYGILRLLRHANLDKPHLVETVSTTLEAKLRNIQIIGRPKIETQLIHKGHLIPGSQTEVAYFVDKTLDGDEAVWKLYINAEAEEDHGKICLALTQVIAEACEGLLRDSVAYVTEMLRTDPTKIWSVLDDMGIRQDDSYDPFDGNVLPQPGNFIPIEDHHLLNEAFEEFSQGEYVGLELEDPSFEQKDGDATFIYAIITGEVEGQKDATLYSKLYLVKVDRDRELQQKESADLYKFHRIQSIEAYEERTYFSDEQKSKILAHITEMVENTFRLPEQRRRKIIKRVYLQWHPEKSRKDEAFCQQVLQHLKNEVARLKQVELQRTGSESESSQETPYEAFFDLWTARAQTYHASRQSYRKRYEASGGASMLQRRKSGIPPSFSNKNPQPGEASRWFRQAEADLRAAGKDLVVGNPSFEWACFKSHQAAEKALKAAQYADDAFKTHAHSLVRIVSGLGDSELLELARQLEDLVVDSTRMRYPDRVCYPQIPNEVYSGETAATAHELARTIVDKVRTKIAKL
ncbi:sacsin-like isoform X2 [Montipora capricornis]